MKSRTKTSHSVDFNEVKCHLARDIKGHSHLIMPEIVFKDGLIFPPWMPTCHVAKVCILIALTTEQIPTADKDHDMRLRVRGKVRGLRHKDCMQITLRQNQVNHGLTCSEVICGLWPVVWSRVLTQIFQSYEALSLFIRVNHHGNLCWPANLLWGRLRSR